MYGYYDYCSCAGFWGVGDGDIPGDDGTGACAGYTPCDGSGSGVDCGANKGEKMKIIMQNIYVGVPVMFWFVMVCLMIWMDNRPFIQDALRSAQQIIFG